MENLIERKAGYNNKVANFSPKAYLMIAKHALAKRINTWLKMVSIDFTSYRDNRSM